MGILDGVRIVDLTTGMAGSIAVMLLAEVGADVVLVEGTQPGPERSRPSFRTWNRSKRSVAIDRTTVAGKAQLEQLLSGADILIHELGPTAAKEAGLDDTALATRHPQLIVSSVLSWPMNHPKADMAVDELLAVASLGACDEQLPWRRGGPVYLRSPLANACATYLAATGIVARLLVRNRTGQIGPAHTSLAQGALTPLGQHWRRAENPSPVLLAGMPKELRGSQATIYQCSDGKFMHVMGNPANAPRVAAYLAEHADETPNTVVVGPWTPDPSHVRDVFLTDTRENWLAELWGHDVPVQVCAEFGDLFRDEQARINGYIIDVDDPEAGRITMAGYPLTVSPPQQIVSTAPAHGADTADVLTNWKPKTAAPKTGTSVRYPLEGVKVVDFGNFLAGPYAPQMFADLGATVIKIEATTGDQMRYVEWSFAGCQRGKRGVALDLKAADAKIALKAAIEWADIVHHNLRMPAARRLGLDYDAVKAINPNVIFCHTSSYGPTGPRADWPGYDQLFQAQTGWEVLGAGEGNPPMWLRFGYMDHQCALSSALATLLALYHRDQTGEGQAVAGSLLGAGTMTTSETYLKADGTLAPFAGLDAMQTAMTDGRKFIELSDGWVAVAADSDTQIAACTTIDRNDTVEQALKSLAASGVPAVKVELEQPYSFFSDADNRAAGLVAEYQHAEWGKLEQPGALWFFDDLDVQLHLAPPALGQHTRECLAEFGLDQATIDALLASGAAKQF
ncbi:MAG: CoA transferase [Acidimicrobiia bacterium]